MSVLVLGPGQRPPWLRRLAPPKPGADPEAIVVVNDLSREVLPELARACAASLGKRTVPVALLTPIAAGQDPARALLDAIPQGLTLRVDPRLAMALLGARWPRCTLRSDAEATTFEYSG